MIELSPPEAALLVELRPALGEVRFEVEPFGSRAVHLRAVPGITVGKAPEDLFRACLQDLGQGHGAHAARDRMGRLAIATACHTAIRAGDPLDGQMMRGLLDDLARTCDLYPRFHSWPTMVRVSRSELERWFYRRM